METAAPDTQLAGLTEYYRNHLSLDFRQFQAWDLLQEMRLVANSTKHGEGRSAEELRNMRPELFQHPALRKYEEDHFPQIRLQLPLGGDGLYVTAEDFRRYEIAANSLLQFVYEHFNSNQENYFPR